MVVEDETNRSLEIMEVLGDDKRNDVIQHPHNF